MSNGKRNDPERIIPITDFEDEASQILANDDVCKPDMVGKDCWDGSGFIPIAPEIVEQAANEARECTTLLELHQFASLGPVKLASQKTTHIAALWEHEVFGADNNERQTISQMPDDETSRLLENSCSIGYVEYEMQRLAKTIRGYVTLYRYNPEQHEMELIGNEETLCYLTQQGPQTTSAKSPDDTVCVLEADGETLYVSIEGGDATAAVVDIYFYRMINGVKVLNLEKESWLITHRR